jgi:quinoprotein glucose dehydrogenase
MRWLLFMTLFAATMCARGDFFDAEEAAKKFELPPGYTVQTIAAEPLLENPVAFSMDEKGRIWVAETHRLDNAVVDITKNTNWIRDDLSFRLVSQRERFLTNAFGTNAGILTKNDEILRLLKPGATGRMENAEVAWGWFRSVSSGLMAGVLARDNKVWVACIPSLWRLEDYGGALQSRRVLSSGYGVHIGVTGHDLHGLTMGMDGKIYFSIGDRGFSVRSGPTTLNYPDTGAVLRCNVDGGELEVVAIGLRNPQELTFDELGNLWTADNDTAGEDKSRLIHVVEGADYGWRTSYQHMKGLGPWVQEKVWEGKIDGTLPTAGEPAQGPAGFAYYPGVGLGEEMKGRFLLCDFPGGIQSFAVEPKGASYVIKDKKRFLWNAWPTDVEFGTDGYCYFSDWVGGWTLPNKGRIYRFVQTNGVPDGSIAATGKILQGGFEDKDTATLLGYLEHEDLRVRLNAHLALGKKRESNAALRQLATDKTKPRTARLHAIWALRMQGAIEANTVVALVSDADAEVRAQAVGSASITNIVRLLRDENPRVKFYAAQALQRKALFDPNSSGASEAILELLEKNADSDAFLTHAGVRVLIFSPPALLKARKHASVSVRRAAMLASRSIGSITIGNFLDDPALAYEAARAIYDVPIPTALPKVAERLTTNCAPEIHSRAINANFRIGGAEPARRLATFAAAVNVPARSRIEALECLADWEFPDDIDRVLGLWRPIKPDALRRAAAIALAAMEPHWPKLWRETNAEIVKASLNCAGELLPPNQATNVLAIFNDASRAVEVRVKALEVLRDLDEASFAGAIELGLKDEKLRIGALALVQTNSPPSVIKRVVETVSQANDVATLQATLAAIRKTAPAEAVEPLKRLLAGKVAPEVALDVSQTAAMYAGLKESAEAAVKDQNPLLAGGNAIEGRRVFERSDVACVRCHAVKGNGGTVGPALDGIGAKQTRAYLLDAILLPNKEIAQGYDNLLITHAGGVTAGMVIRETGVAVEINSIEDGPVTIQKADIRNIARGLSAMPEGLGQLLTPFELRDLVEYLASLK